MPWKTNLPAMGVAAQQELEVGVGGLPVNLRRVRDENRKRFVRDIGGSLLDIVDAVEMGIVNARKVDVRAAARDRLAFVEENLDAHVLEPGNEADRIVIAEDAVDRPLERSANFAIPARVASYGP